MALVLAANFEFAGCEKQKIMRLMTMSVETVRMAKSRPRKNQSQRVDFPEDYRAVFKDY